MRINGRRVVVTGASAGIGRETAVLFARKGASVLAVARSEGPLRELAASAEAAGRIEAFVGDVADAASRAAILEAAGDVDVLVNNAGIGWTGLVEEMSDANVRTLFEINVIGLIELTRLALPGMLARRRGHIVNVASVAGFVSMPPLTVYSATKFAVRGFSEGLRREVAGRGVSVTVVNPGPVATLFASRAAEQQAGGLTTAIPFELNPGVPPSLVARAVLRSARYGWVPGYGSITVPRVAGLSRLGGLPVAGLTVDAASFLSRRVWSRARNPRPGM